MGTHIPDYNFNLTKDEVEDVLAKRLKSENKDLTDIYNEGKKDGFWRGFYVGFSLGFAFTSLLWFAIIIFGK